MAVSRGSSVTESGAPDAEKLKSSSTNMYRSLSNFSTSLLPITITAKHSQKNNMGFLATAVALVAAQGGFIYGLDSGMRSTPFSCTCVLTSINRHHRNDFRS